jgi:hypothetical protein
MRHLSTPTKPVLKETTPLRGLWQARCRREAGFQLERKSGRHDGLSLIQ